MYSQTIEKVKELTSLTALAQNPQSAFKQVMQLHLDASEAVKKRGQVEFVPKWAVSIPLTLGA
jgi:hypothetical protein